MDGGAPLLDLRGGRLRPRRPLRPLRLRPPEAARPPHVQAHPETDDVRRLTFYTYYCSGEMTNSDIRIH